MVWGESEGGGGATVRDRGHGVGRERESGKKREVGGVGGGGW